MKPAYMPASTPALTPQTGPGANLGHTRLLAADALGGQERA